jgi:hypothetical protein
MYHYHTITPVTMYMFVNLINISTKDEKKEIYKSECHKIATGKGEVRTVELKHLKY